MDKKKITEFFADKKSRRFIGLSALTFLGLIGALALQTVWLYNTYSLIKNNILTECNKILEVSLNKETSIIAKQLPEGTRIIGGANTDTIPQATYLYEGVSQLGYQLSLHRIDSIAGHLLAQKDISCKYSIRIVNTQDAKTSIKSFPKTFITIHSAIIPIKTDLSQGIQLILYNQRA